VWQARQERGTSAWSFIQKKTRAGRVIVNNDEGVASYWSKQRSGKSGRNFWVPEAVKPEKVKLALSWREAAPNK